jgi:hypothetical protein
MLNFRKAGSLLAAVAVFGLAVLGSPARAVIVFDFEDVLGPGPLVPNPTEVPGVAQMVGGLVVDIVRSSGSDLEVWDLDVFGGPPTWGFRSIGPFNDPLTDDFFVATFSAPISSATIEYGDFGADTDSTIILEAYSGPGGSGALVASSASAWDDDFFVGDPPGSISVAGASILSLLFKGGSAAFPQSLFWDNLAVEPAVAVIPEPGTLGLLIGFGVVGSGFFLRRRR